MELADCAVVARAEEPFGPVMRARAEMLRARGLMRPGQDREELVVVDAVASSVPSTVTGGDFEDVA